MNLNVKFIDLVPFIAIAMRIASPVTADASYLLLAGYALLGRDKSIQALALSWLFSMFHPGLVAASSATSIGRYAVLLSAALSNLIRGILQRDRRPGRNEMLLALTILIGAFLIIHSLAFSAIVDVSMLKAISWTVAMGTIIEAWSQLTEERRERLARQLFYGLAVIAIVSLPLLMSPYGYRRNGTGFQGILTHPQAFGPAMALLGAWAASHMLGQRQPTWSNVLLVGMSLFLVVRSEARTGGVALIISIAMVVLIAPQFTGKPLRTIMPGLFSGRTHAVVVLSAVLSLAFGALLKSEISSFISKRTDSSNIVDSYQKSRGGLIDLMWENIRRDPLVGLGFGIASSPGDMVVQRDPLLGLPTGAVIEKGVMPVAVLEEVGIVGFVIIMFWIGMILTLSIKAGVEQFSVCLTALLLNLGESTLFSPGGMGMLSLLLIGWAVTRTPRKTQAVPAA